MTNKRVTAMTQAVRSSTTKQSPSLTSNTSDRTYGGGGPPTKTIKSGKKKKKKRS